MGEFAVSEEMLAEKFAEILPHLDERQRLLLLLLGAGARALVAANAGWVNVGTDHDTAAFAVESIRRWWNAAGRAACPAARRLLVTAGAGGTDSYRTRARKTELTAFALEAGLAVTVCHFPPGTSKWNKIERRLFSRITMNWRGRPLTSHEVIVNTIAATTTRTGLTVRAGLDCCGEPPGQRRSGAKPQVRATIAKRADRK